MQYTPQMLQSMETEYGEAFYLLDINRFIGNYRELLSAFRAVYPKTEIAYSYKTNYIPALCRAVNGLGGYAEVVSHMEYALARRIGVPFEKIVFNGPYKRPDAVRELLLGGGTVHLDSARELEPLQALAKENPGKQLNVGIRVNFPIGDGKLSRFGFDVEGDDFLAALRCVEKTPNLHLQALHCHFAPRDLETWKPRAAGMAVLVRRFGLRPDRIDLGGGMFGKMDERLKRQFGGEIPSYQEYAKAVGEGFQPFLQGDTQPVLMIEPGSALVGDCMDLAAKVFGVKTIREHRIATVLASTHNIQMGSKTPSVDVISMNSNPPDAEGPVDIAGYTCIESDLLVRDYPGPVSAGDYVVFYNVGSYSIVLKPPFILPNVPVLIVRDGQPIEVAKRAEEPGDVFQTYFQQGETV